MGTPRLLTDPQEVEIALGVLCGFPIEDFTEAYGVGPDMIRNNILGKRSKEWENPLVEFYRQTPTRQRVRNGVHIYLAQNDRHVPHPELLEHVPRAIDDKIEALYEPAVAGVTHDTNLLFFVEPQTGYERVVAETSGRMNPLDYTRRTLLDRLEAAYLSDEKMLLSKVLSQTKDDILTVIRNGGFTASPEKLELVNRVLEGLTPREREVVKLRYGFDKAPMTLEEVSQVYEVNRERIRQVEAKALRKLRHPKLEKQLRFLAQPRTNEEVQSYLSQIDYLAEQAIWTERLEPGITERVLAEAVSVPGRLEELQELRERDIAERYGEVAKTLLTDMDFSIRTGNCLENANITTIGDLLEKTEPDMLKTKNFGRKSLNEIKEILRIDYDITWPIK